MFIIFTYAAETWTIKSIEKQGMDVLLLNVVLEAHVKNILDCEMHK